MGLGAGTHPANPALWWGFLDAACRQSAHARQVVRSRGLRHWLTDAGLREVWQRTTIAERWQPLRPVERQYLSDSLAFKLRLAHEIGLPEADLATWRSLSDPSSPDYILDHPNFYHWDGHVLTVGRV